MTNCFDPDKLVQLDKKNLWHHIVPHKTFQKHEPLIVVEGKGTMVKDHRGNEYLDALSGGIWCVNVGYGRKSIADAIYEQLLKVHYYNPSLSNVPSIMLAEKLTSLLPRLQKVYYSNSGSEANEKAFKILRLYFNTKYPEKQKQNICYRFRAFHGTTIATLSATGQPERRAGFEPLAPGFIELPHPLCYRCHFDKTYPHCDIDCARALETVIKKEGEDRIAGVLVEPITAGGGILLPAEEYLGVLQGICRKYEVKLIIDEVVTGFGRTGKMFGHEHWDVDPDMVTMAKGFASSYMPISATVTKQEFFDHLYNEPEDKVGYFRDVSTYAGCAAAAAAALENIRIIEEENLCENARVVGEHLLGRLKELESFDVVGEARGKGLFAGLDMVEDKKTKAPAPESYLTKIVEDVKGQGILIGKMNRSIPGLNNVIALAPPLILTIDEADRIVDALKLALERQKI